MYCGNCGKEINPNAIVCVGCNITHHNSAHFPNDSGGNGWVFLGWFLSMTIPLLLLIFICVWQANYPKRVKSLAKGMLVDFIIQTSLVIISIIAMILIVNVFFNPSGAIFWGLLSLVFYSLIFVGTISFFWGLITLIVYICTKPRTT